MTVHDPGTTPDHRPSSTTTASAVSTSLSTVPDDLVSRGWSLIPNFLSPSSTSILRGAIERWHADGSTRAATIGRGSTQQLRPDIRGDHILWIDSDTPPVEAIPALTALNSLRQHLNRTLYLGLRTFEGHAALYPPGAFYAKHVDRPRGTDRRLVSCVLYLNDAWQPHEGGHLRIFQRDDHDVIDTEVPPRGGSLVCFLSDAIAHEVLPMTRTRISLTGWFLND